MKRLAVCIPTFNRSDAVEQILTTEYRALCTRGVDLIFYDSSTDGATEQLIRVHLDAGGQHLAYRKVDPSVHSSQKVFDIYKDVEGSDYDYVWMIHDHTVFGQEALELLCRGMEEDADLILLDMEGNKTDCRKIESIDELSPDAWIFSRYGTAVLRVDTFLRGVDWTRYEGKYLKGPIRCWSHAGFYLERAAELGLFRGLRLELPRQYFTNIYADRPYSWSKDSLRISTAYWGEMLDALPDPYTSKATMLRSVNANFYSVSAVAELKMAGNYGLGDYFRCRKVLKRLVPERLRDYFLLAALPRPLAKRYNVCRLHRRLNVGPDEQLLIYGAGYHGGEFARRLAACGIPFDGFLVSSMEGNRREWMGHPVYVADDYLADKKALIVVAVSMRSAPEIGRYVERLQTGRNRLRCLYAFQL